jgi:hypothetical protein
MSPLTFVKPGRKMSAFYFEITHDLENPYSNTLTATTRIQQNILMFNKRQQESMTQ